MRRYLPGLAGPAPVPEIGLSADVIGSCQSVTSAVFFSGRLVMASPAPAFSSHIDMRNITQGKSLNMSVLDMRTCMFLDANHHLLGCEPALFLGFGFANLRLRDITYPPAQNSQKLFSIFFQPTILGCVLPLEDPILLPPFYYVFLNHRIRVGVFDAFDVLLGN